MRRARSDTELDKIEITERHNSQGNSQWNRSNRKRSLPLSPYLFLKPLQLRETKATQTERQNRPFRYQIYRVTDEPVKIELSVKSERIPFNLWNNATLEIAFKEEQSKEKHSQKRSANFTTISLGSSISGPSKCDVKRIWVFRKDRNVNLVFSLTYKNKKESIVKPNVKDTETVSFKVEDKTEKAEFKISIKKTKPDVIYQDSPCLCNDELNFVEKRTEIVHNALRRIDVNTEREKVPRIAIIGSGGGMRAVIGMGAALDQLKQEKILDCTMYTAGLSGSAWYLLTLYAYDETKLEPADVNKHIQAKLENKTRIYFWMVFKVLTYYIKNITDNHANYFTFTNLFGELIGDLLLSNRSTQNWSDLAQKLEQGCNPLPLISALHVQDEQIMETYNEWMEFSPYQVLLPRYGAAIEMKRFGDKFHRGFCTQKYEERPIHFLHGLSGSAYTIVRDYRPQGNEWYIPGLVGDRKNITNSGIWSLFNKFDSAFVAKVPNFLHGITGIEKISEITDFDQYLNDYGDLDLVEKDDKITLLKTSSKGLKKKKNSVKYNRWSKIKDFIWSLVKGFTKVALTMSVLNFGYKVPFKADVQEYEKKMMLVDAGIAFNSPYPSVLHPARKVDIILSFDFSDRGEDAALPFEELKKAEKWAREKGISFPELYPQLNMIEEKWIEGDQKEVYIFPGSDSPTIVHFVMINKSFRLENGSSNEKLEKFLEMYDLEDILYQWKSGSVISEDEKRRIEACPTKDDQKNKLLEIMMKQGEPAYRELVVLFKSKSYRDLFVEVLGNIPMDKILDDMTKGSVISADEKHIYEQNIQRDKKIEINVLLEIGEKRRAASKQLIKTLQKNNCKLLAKKLNDALEEFGSKEGFREKFDEIIGNLKMEEMLCNLVSDSMISADMKRRIQEYPTHTFQKSALLEIIAKRREPALKQLVKKLQKKSCDPNNFDILPDYGTFRFSYSKEEFEKFNSLVRHNVKKNMCSIIKCIKVKNAEKKTTYTEEIEILPTPLRNTF